MIHIRVVVRECLIPNFQPPFLGPIGRFGLVTLRERLVLLGPVETGRLK
jgi:hypothetical protein